MFSHKHLKFCILIVQVAGIGLQVVIFWLVLGLFEFLYYLKSLSLKNLKFLNRISGEGFMQHLAIIPDGNRRWAKQNKLQTVLGHNKGGQTIRTAVSVCLQNKIKYLSVYIFSLENFNRSDQEKEYIFKMIPDHVEESKPDLLQNRVRVQFLGDRTVFPDKTLNVINSIEEETKSFDNLTLSFLFCYGGRQEILHAVKDLCKDVVSGAVSADTIDERILRNYLWSSCLPDPDLIIRTSGISRLSNFFTFQAAYSELMFLDCYWPEVDKECLQKCIDDYANISRNFGK
jgi:undecaprenyl diphosphate synthase